MSNYATKKELEHATGVDTSDLAAKKDFIALKVEVDKLDIANMVNVSTSLNNLKTKVDDLDVSKLKTNPVYLKKLSDVMANKVVENTKFNTLETKVNNLDKKIPDATTLIHIYHSRTGKQNLQNKTGNTRYKWFSDSNYFEYKISKVENEIPDTISLVTTTVLDTKIGEAENKIPAENIAARLKQADLVRKNDFDNKLIQFNSKITSNKTK